MLSRAAKGEARRLAEEMDLAGIRRALRLSQDELAQTLQVGQDSVAKLEKRADMYVSTLRRVIEAMGGELEIVALSRPRRGDQEFPRSFRARACIGAMAAFRAARRRATPQSS